MRNPVLVRALATVAATVCFALAGCAGMTPAPRYTSAPGAGGEGLSEELRTRQRAQRSGNSSRLLRVVQGYLGVPYKWGGTTRNGMDCSALTRAVYREAYGVELPRTSGQMYRLGKEVASAGNLRAGDLVFFRIAQAVQSKLNVFQACWNLAELVNKDCSENMDTFILLKS